MAEAFPVKPKLRPTSSKLTPTPEAKYWRSFKIPKDIETTPSKSFTFPINSIAFSPTDPHDFVATHSASVSIFSGKTLEPKPTISSFSDTAAAVSFRCDGKLLAAGDLTGTVHVFDAKSRSHLRRLKGHAAAVRSGTRIMCGAAMLRLLVMKCSVMELNHEKPVESVIYLPSGGLIATAGGNFVKIWDVIGGGKLLYSMESHIKTVTALCMGKVARGSGEEVEENRILSVALDGYMKVFDYAKSKITHSMRFPEPLLSVGFSPDCSTRVIGTSKGNLYIGRRKAKAETEEVGGSLLWKIVDDEPGRKVLRPSYFRYFQRGQNLKPSEGDYLIKRPKKVKMAEFDKLLKKFRHREALVAALNKRNPESVVAVMEELVARKKLMKCVSNLDMEELGLLLSFLQKYSTMPRYAGLLTRLANRVVESRAEDIRSSDKLRNFIRNLKRDVDEEIRIQQSLLEIQGIISPMLMIAAKR
ncbi:protein SLOW WALKER 1-like [Salvia divinorum]|uniref:Protein SLOW WALKER 1-like n=1 Tax=Salvia divinorum TaxID=28513 RepID=A0ABD1HT72_SALDI